MGQRADAVSVTSHGHKTQSIIKNEDQQKWFDKALGVFPPRLISVNGRRNGRLTLVIFLPYNKKLYIDVGMY